MGIYSQELALIRNTVPDIYRRTETQVQAVSYKKQNEIVTSSDLFIETEIIKAIKASFPDDYFHSEEFNRDTLLKDRTWLIDPIDGTSNYVHHLDLYVVQIALFDKGEVVLSYIYAPKLGKIYHAVKGEGAYLNGKRIFAYAEGEEPNRLMSMVGLSHQTTKDKRMFMRMIDFSYRNRIKVRILGTLGLEMALMAEGSFVLLYTDVTNFWDIAPGLLLVKEAGGIIVNHEGKPYTMGESHMIVCCDEAMKEQVLSSL